MQLPPGCTLRSFASGFHYFVEGRNGTRLTTACASQREAVEAAWRVFESFAPREMAPCLEGTPRPRLEMEARQVLELLVADALARVRQADDSHK